jgi:hypothetical protein
MRYRFLILAGLICGGLLGYYMLWSHLSDQIAAQAQAWMESQRKLGREVSYGAMRQWGFPYRLSLTFENVRWRDPNSAAAWDIQADDITAHLQLWNPDHVIFVLTGRQQIGWKDGAAQLHVALTAENFRASAVFDAAGKWQRLAADLHQARLEDAGQALSAARLNLHARRAETVPPSSDLAIQAEGLILPPQASLPDGGPLGREIARLDLIGTLRGTVFGKTPQERLANWRDGGGVIDFETIGLQWGALKLKGNGTLTLDKLFRPLGAMSSQVYGADAGIDALAAAGRMKADEAAAAKAVLMAIAKRDETGERYLQVPLTAQDGRLFLGPVALFGLPPIWPAQ